MDLSRFPLLAQQYPRINSLQILANKPLDLLKQKRYLLVLDGLERILIAYHRMNAPQLTEDHVDIEVTAGVHMRSCTDPRDGEFLRSLTGCHPSKVLISTRLYPLELQIDRNNPKPTIRVSHYLLRGIYPPAEALALLHYLGVHGNSKTIMDFTQQFDNHALLLNVVAGLVINYRPAPGDFDAWYESEGHHLNLHKLDIKQRRTNILHSALTGLAPEAQKLLSRIAAFRYSVDYKAVSVLNPYEPLHPRLPEIRDQLITILEALENSKTNGNSNIDERLHQYNIFLRKLGAASTDEQRLDLQTQFLNVELESNAKNMEVKKLIIDFSRQLDTYRESMTKYMSDVKVSRLRFDEVLSDLENRGLLQWDRENDRYDLHPVVRGYAFELLEDNDKKTTYKQIKNHFESLPSEDLDQVKEIGQIRRSLEIYNALIGAGLLNEAVDYYDSRISYLLLSKLAAYISAIELLTPFFPQGFDIFPTELSSIQQDKVIKDLASAFYYVGKTTEAAHLQTLLIEKNLKSKDAAKLVGSLIDLSMTLRADSKLAVTLRLRELAHEIAVITNDIYKQISTDFCLLS